jgi:hypothetical protein
MPILNGATLLERARRHADDTVEPYFISDSEMYQYLTEAERALATAGKLLRSVEEYTISEDDRWVRIRPIPELIELRAVTLVDSSGNRYPLKLLGTLDTPPSARESSNYDYGLTYAGDTLTPGRPKALVLGKRSDHIELSPPANATYTLEVSVVHYPKYDIERSADEPSIGERHHQAISIGAALFALEGSEHEHLRNKIESLNAVWQRALMRAAEESGIMNRDAGGPVYFSNDLW